VARSKSSVGSSNEVNLLDNFKLMENIKSTVEELNKIMENLDLGESLGYSDKGSDKNFNNYLVKDFTTRSGGVSNNNENMWRPGGKHSSSID
jgi:hypothetical protein